VLAVPSGQSQNRTLVSRLAFLYRESLKSAEIDQASFRSDADSRRKDHIGERDRAMTSLN
jgi:hypothetical protein